MKITEIVTKGRLFVLLLCSVLLCQGCGNSGTENMDSSNNLSQENLKENSSTISSTKGKDSLLHFSEDVSVIKVSRSNSGGQKSWNMDKKDISQFRDWVLSLQLEYQNLDKDKLPGDVNGGDAWTFQISDEDSLTFTYMDIGNSNCYMEINGKWYLITNYENIPDFLYHE